MKVHIGKYPNGNEPRKVEVKLHNFDCVNLDHTLALIIYPCLVEFKELFEGGHAGVPTIFTDFEELFPEELRVNEPTENNSLHSFCSFHSENETFVQQTL